MLKISKIWGSVISLALLLGVAANVKAAEMPAQHSPNQFRRIEQPLSLKVAVTVGGLSLIALELWWFLSMREAHLKGKGEKER